MLYGKRLDTLSLAIIAVLTDKTALTYDQLSLQLQTDHHMTPATSTLYRRLQDLCDESVLVYNKKKYMLSTAWCARFHMFAEEVLSPLLLKSVSKTVLGELELNSYRDIHASSLSRLDPLWNSLLLELRQSSGSQSWYGYNSHPWFAIGTYETEAALFETLQHSGADCYLIYGHSSVLDDYGANLLESDTVKIAKKKLDVYPEDGFAIWSNGVYTIECTFPAAITEKFKTHFSHTESISELPLEQFQSIFEEKSDWSLRVSHAPDRAQQVIEVLHSAI